jgi:hypothetical protein
LLRLFAPAADPTDKTPISLLFCSWKHPKKTRTSIEVKRLYTNLSEQRILERQDKIFET